MANYVEGSHSSIWSSRTALVNACTEKKDIDPLCLSIAVIASFTKEHLETSSMDAMLERGSYV